MRAWFGPSMELCRQLLRGQQQGLTAFVGTLRGKVGCITAQILGALGEAGQTQPQIRGAGLGDPMQGAHLDVAPGAGHPVDRAQRAQYETVLIGQRHPGVSDHTDVIAAWAPAASSKCCVPR
jgi:hypothetical protein